ncbi:biliverdin-producing heme oxygenase [Parvularcula oceani]|uniref:biliverdin-producing heme oxygenase n=1 Tax=Parvularcula oceani TaxID=1247963 RepID=UPI00068C1934|nr:biliverdin-producing heme oxygenase [Parvularcula oceani]
MRDYLREGTRTAHEAVDAVFGRFDLTRREGYTAFLRAHYRGLFGLPLDPAPFGLKPLGLMELVAADLRTLGEPLPAPLPAPRFSGEAEALGAYYVVAGSRLGSRLLARQWREGADGVLLSAGRYLSDEASHDAWRDLTAFLRQEGAMRPSSVLDGALRTFDHFHSAGLAEQGNEAVSA